MIFDGDDEFEERTQELIHKFTLNFSTILANSRIIQIENKLSPQLFEEIAKSINRNILGDKFLVQIIDFINNEIYSEYDYISYLIYVYFIKNLDDEKLMVFRNISTGFFHKILMNYCKNEEILILKYNINNILAEWDPIGIPFSIKFDEYTSYIDPIFSLGNNKNELEKYLIHLVEDIIGLSSDNKFQKDGIRKSVDKIIQLYE